MNGWTDDLETNRRKGIDLARQALRVAPDDPDVLATAAFALGYFGEDIDAAIAADRPVSGAQPELCSRLAVERQCSGILPVNPISRSSISRQSLRLSPRDRIGSLWHPIGHALISSTRQFDEAAAMLLASLEQAPSFAVTYRFLASCYAHMGRLDEAREIVKRLRAITPVVVPSVIPYRNPEHRELFLSGLRLAAGETT